LSTKKLVKNFTNIKMANNKKGSSTETEQIVSNEVNETLTVDTKPEVNETLTPDVKPDVKPEPVTIETLEAALRAATDKLRAAEDANNLDESHPDVKAAFIEKGKAKKALNDFKAEIAKNEAALKMEADMANAKQVLNDELGISEEILNNLLTFAPTVITDTMTEDDKKAAADKNANDAGLHAKRLSSVKWAFGLIFGKPEINVKQGATGKDVSRGTSTETEKPAVNGKTENVNDVVKSLMDSGLTHQQLLDLGHEEGRLRNVAYKIDYAKDKVTGVYAKRSR
jgi:hypothetical protein